MKVYKFLFLLKCVNMGNMKERKTDHIHIRVNREKKEALLRLLRKRKTPLSTWLRRQVEEYLLANS